MHWLTAHWDRFTPVSALLSPLSLLFRAAVALRRAMYAAGLAPVQRLPVPVIVVGNVTVGGTGKTPAVLWLAQHLRARGYRPGIVSRGYGGASTLPRRVMPDSDPGAYGDEAVLLADRSGSPVWTGIDRAAAASALLAAEPACNVLISDDGLQHYRLGRDLEVCVIDGARGLGNGWVLPAGPLREPPSRLATVDAIVINGSAGQSRLVEAATAAYAATPRFRMALEGHDFYNLVNLNHRIRPESLRGRRLHAIAGIGDPGRFFRHLQALGLDFVAHPFPDHHSFRAADIDYAEADAIVMTEKDAVKCRSFAADTHWVLPVDAEIEDRFGEFVLRRLETLSATDKHR
jgi:tetraacyldisaccharide 4'-kinase